MGGVGLLSVGADCYSGRVVDKVTGAPQLALLGFVIVTIAFVLPVLDVWARLTIANAALAVIGLVALDDNRRARLRPTLTGTVLGVISGAALYGGAWMIDRVPAAAAQTHQFVAWTAGHSIGFVAATLPIAVLGEELFWRAALLGALRQRLPLLTSVAASTVVYALAHAASGTWLLPFAAFGAGLVWALLFAATGNLTASVVSHLVFDVLVILVAPLA